MVWKKGNILKGSTVIIALLLLLIYMYTHTHTHTHIYIHTHICLYSHGPALMKLKA